MAYQDFKEKARVLKDGCFLVEVLPAENENNYEYLYQIKKYAKALVPPLFDLISNQG